MAKSKSDIVLKGLRGRIIDGGLRPGQRLSTFDDLEAEFDVSRAVVQSAVARLQRDGFVRTINRQGLFVAEHPPHLFRYGLAFAEHPHAPSWSRFHTALVNEAHRIERERRGCRIVVYRDLMDPEAGREALRRLKHDVESERLAGLILNPGTHELPFHPPFDSASTPKVFIAAAFDSPCEPKVRTDRDQLYLRALHELAARGRRRVAIINMADAMYRLDLAAMYNKCGLSLKAPWDQLVGRSNPEVARGLVTLLMDYPPEQRPDGLIVADDNLVEHAAAGLLDSGVRLGSDLDVVVHCNWPWPVPSILPLQRIGYDAGEMLSRAIACVDQMRAGETPPADQTVPALFESEVKGAGTVATVVPVSV